MRDTISIASITALVGAAAMTASIPSVAGAASVTGCAAGGGKQETGAVLGALVGAAIGNNVAKNERGLGTVVGAGAGAAAGSYIGCSMQESDARKGLRPWKGQASGVFVATSNVNVRSGPSTRNAKIGSVYAGERFTAVGQTGDWVLIDRGGRRGYVSAAYVRPV